MKFTLRAARLRNKKKSISKRKQTVRSRDVFREEAAEPVSPGTGNTPAEFGAPNRKLIHDVTRNVPLPEPAEYESRYEYFLFHFFPPLVPPPFCPTILI